MSFMVTSHNVVIENLDTVYLWKNMNCGHLHNHHPSHGIKPPHSFETSHSVPPSATVPRVLPWLEVQSQTTVRKQLMGTLSIPRENGTTIGGMFSSYLRLSFIHS
jgi:hypothetical protein